MGTITDGLIAWYPLDDTAEIGKVISGNSYIQLPEQLLAGVDDKIGITVSAWVCEDVAASVWERIFDFGDGQMGPYLFLTRGMRGRVSILTGSWWRTDESVRPPVAPTSCWANGGKLWRTVAVTQTIILEDPSLRQMMIFGAQ